MARPIVPLRERFLRFVEPEPMSGCFLWTGAIDPCGYGRIAVNGRNRTASRIAWMLFRGEIPPGAHVLHKCDVRSCVSVDHLFLGTHKENMADMARKNRSGGGGTNSGLYGAYPHAYGGVEARVRFNKVDYYLGRFGSADEAHAVAVAFKDKCYREGAPK